MIGICVNVNDPDLFFVSSRGVAMATNFMAKFGYAFIRHSGLEKRLAV